MRLHPSRHLTGPILLVALTFGTVACSDAGSSGDDPAPRRTPDTGRTDPTGPSPSPTPTRPDRASGTVPTPKVAGTVASGLTSPWGLAFLPDGSALVSERDTATIKLIGTDGKVSTIGTVRGVDSSGSGGGEGGLLGIAVAPTFAKDRLVYAYYTASGDNRIARMRYADGRLGPQKILLDGLEQASFHNGGRIEFGPDGLLYATVGDAGDQDTAQDAKSPNGKILRLTPAGEPAPGNPTAGSPVWSLGHRNPQGLAFDDAKRLWAAEFGQDTWDEINLIRPGGNYGWPEVEGRAGGESAYVDPLAQWGTDEASPSGLAYLQDTLWMAALRGERLWAIPVEDGKVTGEPKAFFTGKYGRLRTVVPAPDGSLWATTSNTDGRGDVRDGDDRILRLTLSG